MAGGMRRGAGLPRLSMAERVQLGRSPVDEGPTGTPADGCPGRHCWVADAADHAGVKRPGLLVEWRQAAGGRWEGRVVYLLQLRAGSWATAEEWVAADLLTPC